MADVAVRLEYDPADGVLELMDACRRPNHRELFAVAADIRVPDAFEELARRSAAEGHARERANFHEVGRSNAAHVGQHRYVAGCGDADDHRIVQVERARAV